MEDDHPSPLDLPWPLTGADRLRDELLAAYGEPTRAHHGPRHLSEVLHRLAELAAAGTPFDRTPVLLAAWFHDAVYDGERDAEERSATWAEEALPALTDEATVVEVARLVRLTEHHRPEPHDDNGCALSDADLAILAEPPDRYAQYVAAVRQEYGHLPDDVFAAGRADVLRELASKPQLFHTAHGRAHWEDPARRNMALELEKLQPEG
ncbi:HD domain-containing protein [Nocardioides sp. SYSU DS0651]|uniref:HD domain-containing protein n=1 Tax=Nocardioides sp. SYSU DS0651 TaxID=3415955 RepID=UPI003F4C1EC8